MNLERFETAAMATPSTTKSTGASTIQYFCIENNEITKYDRAHIIVQYLHYSDSFELFQQSRDSNADYFDSFLTLNLYV